ncbi:MAG: hypothetical protein ACKOFG_17465 [Limnohabitans sp.]
MQIQLHICHQHRLLAQGQLVRQFGIGGCEISLLQERTAFEIGQNALRCGVGGQHLRLRRFQATQGLAQGGQQPERQTAGQPEAELLPCLGIQAQQRRS